MPDVVTLIPESGREVIGSVSFHVMMLDVVVKVGIPTVSHERIKDVGEQCVEDDELFAEDTSHVNVLMHHEGVCAHITDLHKAMNKSVNPPEPVKEEGGAWDGRGEVQQQVRNHHDVCLNSNDGARNADVGLKNPLIEDTGQFELAEFCPVEHCWFKVWIPGIVPRGEFGDGAIVRVPGCHYDQYKLH